jgi:hypothetical protein
MHNNLKLVDADKYTPEQKNKVYADWQLECQFF